MSRSRAVLDLPKPSKTFQGLRKKSLIFFARAAGVLAGSALAGIRAQFLIGGWAFCRIIIRIALDVLDRPNVEIHETFLRTWRFYRGQ